MKAEEQGLSNLRLLAADIEECDFSEGRWGALRLVDRITLPSTVATQSVCTHPSLSISLLPGLQEAPQGRLTVRVLGLPPVCAACSGVSSTLHQLLTAQLQGSFACRFDAILCSNAVPFLTDIPAGLAMLRRWLRPGGRLVFNAPRVRVCSGTAASCLAACLWSRCLWCGVPHSFVSGSEPGQPGSDTQHGLFMPAETPVVSLCCSQGFASRAFKVLTDLLAKRGLRLDDPSVLFEDEDSVRGMLTAAGFASVEISASEEVARRLGRTPEDWAASGWKQSRGLPFADLDAVLDEEAVEQLRLEYLAEAEAMVRQFATPEGDIAEPFHMLWVVAHAPE